MNKTDLELLKQQNLGRCVGCRKPVLLGGPYYLAGDGHWHIDCYEGRVNQLDNLQQRLFMAESALYDLLAAILPDFGEQIFTNSLTEVVRVAHERLNKEDKSDVDPTTVSTTDGSRKSGTSTRCCACRR